MMLHRHFENEKEPNLTTSQDLLPRRTEEEEPLSVPLDGEEGAEEQPEALLDLEEEPQAPRGGKGRRGGVRNG